MPVDCIYLFYIFKTSHFRPILLCILLNMFHWLHDFSGYTITWFICQHMLELVVANCYIWDFFFNLKHVNLEHFVAATEKKPYRCNLKENSFCIDVVHLKIQVLVCIRLCYIWVLTLLSSRLELFSVAELI
jgi:hypothetical protein